MIRLLMGLLGFFGVDVLGYGFSAAWTMHMKPPTVLHSPRQLGTHFRDYLTVRAFPCWLFLG